MHSAPVVANLDFEGVVIGAGRHLDARIAIGEGGISGIVEQVDDGVMQRRNHFDATRTNRAIDREAGFGLRAQQIERILRCGTQLGHADPLGRVVASELAEQGADCRERCIQLVRRACRLGGDGEDALVAKGTHVLKLRFSLLGTQGACESGNEEPEHPRGDGEADRHSGQMQVEKQTAAASIADFRQHNEKPHQHQIGGHSECRHCRHRAQGQGRGCQRDGHDQQGHERVARATGQVQQVAQNEGIDGDMGDRLPPGHSRFLAESPDDQDVERTEHRDCREQPGHRNRKTENLGDEHDCDELAANRAQTQPDKSCHELTRSMRPGMARVLSH